MKSTSERRELRPDHPQEPGEVLVFPGFSRPGPTSKTVSQPSVELKFFSESPAGGRRNRIGECDHGI